jgi:RNA polymerase primary sigma factor
MISLDTPVGATGESVLGDLIPDFRQYEPSRFAERHALQITLKNLLNQLTERERRVLQLRYGLIDGQERTLESVGREFGVTRERIRQIEVKALRKLQHPRMSKQLHDFLL